MCEFCHRHGEGKKWYLAVSNYSKELFTDASKRSMRDVLSNLGPNAPAPGTGQSTLASFKKAPRLVHWIARHHQQDVHWGQVVPIEDAFEMVDLLDWIVRLPCTCRADTIGDRNARYCLGVGVAELEEPVRQLFREAVDPSLDVESLTKEQAKQMLADLDKRGSMHSVWTFKSPFIGGLCNCDRDCMAFQSQRFYQFQVMFRAEYVAQVDPDKCNGCRRCMHQCLFGAMTHSLTLNKCAVHAPDCYGCGICRAVCQRDAISLLPRTSVPAVANVWGL